MLDRIDLKVLLTSYDVTPQGHRYASSTVRKDIAAARHKQETRYRGNTLLYSNGNLEARAQFDLYCPDLDDPVSLHFRNIVRKCDISPRQQDKLLFVSQTISDLEDAPRIRKKHLEEAVVLMGLDDQYFRSMY